MRKEPILAVVDEESDVTYYEVKEAKFEFVEMKKEKKEDLSLVEAAYLLKKIEVREQSSENKPKPKPQTSNL